MHDLTFLQTFLADGLPSAYIHRYVNIIFYDNACNLVRHIIKRDGQGQGPFADIRFPVDRFHFTTKHKKTHKWCQEHCNPKDFKYLTTSSGENIFNSAAAENVMPYLGSLANTLRGMNAVTYNFVLNECIRRRNARLVDQLLLTSMRPRHLLLDC